MRHLLATLLLATATAAPAQNDPFGAAREHVTVGIASEQPAIAPGTTFTVGITASHAKDWHSYYAHAGIGQPWSFDWDLPEGFSAGPIQWPVPEVITNFGFPTYGYSDDITLLVDITAPDTLTVGEKVTLTTTANWQQCKESCETKSKTLSLTLDVVEEVIVDPFSPSDSAARFEAARTQLATESDDWQVTASVDGDVTLTITAADPDNATPLAEGDLHFFADSEGQIEDAAEHTLAAGDEPGTYTITLARADDAPPLTTLSGILANDKGWSPNGAPGIPVSIQIAAATGDETAAADETAEEGEDDFSVAADVQAKIDQIRAWGVVGLDGEVAKERGLVAMILFALIGGVILNIMPCVFPVLGIKIMGFVSQAGSSKAHIRMHGLVYAAGVIISLWVLVGVLLAVKAALGTNVNWGFQLQNAAFLAFLIGLMFVFALSLSGVFELGASLTAVGGGLQAKSGYAGSFFTGLLTVLVATPCTGPFMAPAISFALSGSALDTYLIFTGLAVGIAIPYVVLSFFPSLVEKLPRPGPWMETFKQFMAFPLYATVIWLIAVFTKNVGAGGLTWLLAGLLTVAFGAWVYGRYSTPAKKPGTRWLARATAAASIVGLALLAEKGIATKPERNLAAAGDTIEKYGMQWVPFSLDRIIDYRSQGRTVFIDFTADW